MEAEVEVQEPGAPDAKESSDSEQPRPDEDSSHCSESDSDVDWQMLAPVPTTLMDGESETPQAVRHRARRRNN